MATLTPLTVGNGAFPAQWTNGTNGALGDDSDATFGWYLANVDSVVDQGWELSDVDADLSNMDTLFCVLRYGWDVTPTNSVWEDPTLHNGTLGLQVRIIDGATVLAAADSGGTFLTIVDNPTATSPTDSSSVEFTYVNPGATKTQWNAAVVEIRIRRNRLKGGSTDAQRVYEADFTGTYTPTTPARVPYRSHLPQLLAH